MGSLLNARSALLRTVIARWRESTIPKRLPPLCVSNPFGQCSLHGTMKERVLMRPPAGFPVPEEKRGQVWLLLRPLYGTKQGGHEWHEELKSFLVGKHGWTQSELDSAVFMKQWDDGDWALVGFWVDDGTGVGSEKRLIELEELIRERYGVSSAGPAKWMLGMTIERDENKSTVSLGQDAYTDSLLERFDLVNAVLSALKLKPRRPRWRSPGDCVCSQRTLKIRQQSRCRALRRREACFEVFEGREGVQACARRVA